VIYLPPLDNQSYNHIDKDDGCECAWDVTLGNEIIRDGRHKIEWFSLSEEGVTLETIREKYDGIDETYAMKTDLTKPLLLIPYRAGYLLADGWHRLYKACRLGVAMLPMCVLTEEETKSILWLVRGGLEVAK
jgi:hypothetical protein